MKQLLTPDFLDYEELYILSPNIQQKEYQFINLGFENKLSKQILLDLFPRLEKFRLDQLEDLFKIVCDKVDYEDKKNDIKVFITSKKEELPLIREMNSDIKKLFIFDDIAGDREFGDITRTFFSKGRPNNCQAIYLTQQFTEINPVSIRENASCLVLFRTSGSSFDKIYKDMAKEVMENKAEFRMYCNRIWRNKYSYVFINKIDEVITDKIFDIKKNDT